ncbi:Wzz/FepE/Etk N-terminal domain-containing protein [Aquabacterium sp.]|uniref:Wzz/FepE/Etk N-terminal domain-containing protein n=1 Tax=Aquabacterium sp. TaxID=1872578 RepID=UPI0019BAF1F7|nr:Wzz/FepE/Etk N-terminal domain-containing protein [Aquabacterium sp.]MBC7700856.1 lipopolysaccharide biosynthesis protein [Aquabacterium sp.]
MNQNAREDHHDDAVEFSLMDLIETAASHWRLLIAAPIVAGLLALGITFFIKPTFTATTKFLPPQQQQSSAAAMLQNLGALGGFAGAAASGLKNPADQYIAFLKSRSVQDALVKRFQLQARYEVELKGDAVLVLGGKTRISSGKDGLITIEVDDKEPAFAAQLANAHVEELGRLLSRLAITEAQQRRVFFEKQLQQTKGNLSKAELDLKTSGMNASALKSSPAAAVAALAQLQAQITAQEVKLASMRDYLTESAPAFKQAQTELLALKAQGAKTAQSSEQPESGDADYVARYREVKYQENLFELFARQFELAKVDESKEGANVQVVDAAQPPERKSKPRKALIAAVTALIAGFLTLIFVLAREAFRSSGRDLARRPDLA